MIGSTTNELERMSSFKLEKDYRTDEEREKDKLRQTVENLPMDTTFHEDHGPVQPKIQINVATVNMMQENTVELDQREMFDIKRLFDAVASGDVTKLEGLEEYLNNTNKTLTSTDYQSEGKTVLMKALLNLKNRDNQTVKYLLIIAERKNYLNELVNAARIDNSYKGQTALHIAIERRSKHFVSLLIQKGADVHVRACGTFFRPLGETCFYFGELPLSLAACTNQKDIVDLLMEKADVRRTDTLGNTVLHVLVMVADNSPENTDFVVSMYDYILTKDAAKNPNETKLEDIENNQGLTSIKLAAKLGKIGLLQHILQREFQQEECRHLSRKFTEWAYGPVSGSLYELDDVDTYQPNSVLEIVVYGTDTPNRLEMLQIEPLNKLLEDKWNRLAKRIFHIKFIIYFFYLITFTAVSYHRNKETLPHPFEKNVKGYLLFTGQVIMAFGSLYFLIVVLFDLKKKRPSLQKLLVDGYSDLLFLLQAGLFMICVALYFFGKQEYLAFLVLSLALCWVNLLYFSRGSQTMGIYNIMIQRIFLGDIMRFLLVYSVFLIGFSAAVVTLINHSNEELPLDSDLQHGIEDCKKPNFKTLPCTILELFKITIGIGDLEFTEEFEYKYIFYVLLISYIVLTYILLLNMLIALMSKNVEDMSEKSTSIWKLQRAVTILDLERSACCLKMMLRSGVKRNLGETEHWYLRVKEVNWKNCERSLGIINEDPECNTIKQSESYNVPNQRDVRLQRPEEHPAHIEEETLLASTSV